jgi:hypothetical protein
MSRRRGISFLLSPHTGHGLGDAGKPFEEGLEHLVGAGLEQLVFAGVAAGDADADCPCGVGRSDVVRRVADKEHTLVSSSHGPFES